MLQRKEFTKHAPEIINWIDTFFKNIENLPVQSQVKPKDIYDQLPTKAPKHAEEWEQILDDLTNIILPGITHWQHPNFHAYFPANSSVESVYAEFITAALGAQCMIWDTSPAAAELEEKMMDWLKDLMGLPSEFEGCIQDTASTATLVAIITAREWKTNFQSNEYGVPNNLRTYCSSQTHSSIEKGVKIAGMGSRNLIKIGVDDQMRMRPDLLEKAILEDIENNKIPTCVVVATGTTGTVAIDPLKDIAAICKKYNVWLHVDAAFAGTALLLPEYQWMIDGIEDADSFVFNPHKWMFTNFDCTVYFVKNVDLLLRTFEILPEYLKTKTRGAVNDYRDWGIPLGRRFRALKLWFVMRGMGINGIQSKLRKHIQLNDYFADFIQQSDHFEWVTDPILNFTCFRYIPSRKESTKTINLLNKSLLSQLNQTGKAFLSHTLVDDKYVLRMVIGQTYVEQKHIDLVIQLLKELALKIENDYASNK